MTSIEWDWNLPKLRCGVCDRACQIEGAGFPYFWRTVCCKCPYTYTASDAQVELRRLTREFKESSQ